MIFKARYLKHGIMVGKPYTFKSDFVVIPGDVVAAGGKMMQVIDEPVDMEWVKEFGEEKIQAVNKVESEVNE